MKESLLAEQAQYASVGSGITQPVFREKPMDRIAYVYAEIRPFGPLRQDGLAVRGTERRRSLNDLQDMRAALVILARIEVWLALRVAFANEFCPITTGTPNTVHHCISI